MLAEDQIKAVKDIKQWWDSSKAFYILNGGAGYGKTYVVDEVLKNLSRAKPILLAPTHKALRQLREKTHNPYDFKTVASALGIRPIDEGKELKFEQVKLPNFWETINLAVIDEAGMLNEYVLDILKQLGIKILYVGHKSQLPPVVRNRSMFDKCISPVFEQGYGQSDLYIPKRNSGELWEFNKILESKIYSENIVVPTTYDISSKDLSIYIKDSLNLFKSNSLKIALWTNDGVTRYNNRVRALLFNNTSHKYLPEDLIITTNSLVAFNGLEHLNDRQVIRHAKDGVDIYTDTDGEVIKVENVTVKFCNALHIPCYKLTVRTSIEGIITLYEIIYKDDYKKIADHYEHIAWGLRSKEAKDKAYRERSLLLKCFAQVKHFYAATSHRLQGSSVENVITIASDINKNSNRIERAKCMYVACSRASKELFVYKGI